MKRVLVTGGSPENAHSQVYHALYSIHERWQIACVIHGGRSDIDLLAHAWAEQQGITTEVFKADWWQLGLAAGPVSHQRMFEEGQPDYLVAFPGGRGTPFLLDKAYEHGLPVLDLRRYMKRRNAVLS